MPSASLAPLKRTALWPFIVSGARIGAVEVDRIATASACEKLQYDSPSAQGHSATAPPGVTARLSAAQRAVITPENTLRLRVPSATTVLPV